MKDKSFHVSEVYLSTLYDIQPQNSQEMQVPAHNCGTILLSKSCNGLIDACIMLACLMEVDLKCPMTGKPY